MALENMEGEEDGMMMGMNIIPGEGGEDDLRVAAGTATYRCSFRSSSDSCSANRNEYDGQEEHRSHHNPHHHHHRVDDIARENERRASTHDTPNSTTTSRTRTGLLKNVAFSSLVIIFLIVFSQNAQECSSEVVRLRHPDHLYYGDRGGGGVGVDRDGPPVILYRHGKKLENKEEFFPTRRDDIDADEDEEKGLMNILDEDVDDSEVESLLGHTYSSSGHTSAFSANLVQQHSVISNNNNNKRKGHATSNNSFNSNNNNDSNNRNTSASDNDSSNRNSNGFSSSGYTSNSFKNTNNLNNIFNGNTHPDDDQHEREHHEHNHQQDQHEKHHHDHDTAALEDIELPVYFARQGNDEPLEIDQPHVDVSGTSPRGPSTLSGGLSAGSDSPTSLALGSETTPTGTGTEAPEEDGKLFPPDLFTLEQRRKGAVVFYIMGVIYMFVALAIVCDEFFVPSLDVIIEFLAIQDDVAGATFMAAGGSAPELFTSVIGVFISKDDVGIGTIVGSAVFNILFVIGMCAIFSRTVLKLTWWPLFRDCTFYSIALITLIFFFRDSYIYWWEALILFSIYICYVTFMRFNQSFERALKKLLFKNRVTRVSSTDQLVNNKSVNNGASSSQTSVQTVSGNQSSRGSATLKPPLSASGRRNSIPMLHSGSKFRHGLLQLMIQSIDPLHDGRVDEKATQLHAIASLKALLDAAKTEADSTVTNNSRSKPVSPPQVPASVQPSDAPLTTVDIEDQQANGDAPTAQELAALAEAQDEGHEPLDISWPTGNCKKQISYIILFPIMICLFLTLPDTRTPRGKKFFAWGFLGSILWIAVFSYFMVWWADRTGETFGIAPEIMGLTFLAAGTSIPDLITSVIVARKGLGDMAVSSSVGSNIFDVCVGLPVPWLLYGIAKGEPVEVSAKGMLCSISILFGMLCFVVISIMCYRWKMTKGLGLVMFILYFIFLGVSLLFEYNVITCPRFLEA